jgi:peptidoglycan/LPS O-acetylase OafA/YrhL
MLSFKTSANPNRIYGLDIMRAAAILLVLIGHSSGYFPDKLHIGPALSSVAPQGVALFFVLSGYLIGGILIKQFDKVGFQITNLFTFWTRRWLRTLPAYYVTLIVLILLSFTHDSSFDMTGSLKYFVFIQNILTPIPSFFLESWSLGVEEWFYILVPIFLFLLRNIFKIPFRSSVVITSLTIIIAVTFFRYYRFATLQNTHSDIPAHFINQVVTRLDSLMYGVLGAFFSFYYFAKWTAPKKLLLVTGLFLIISDRVLCTVFSHYNNSFYYAVFSSTIFPIGSLLLIPFLSQLKEGSGKFYIVITFISIISYSLYLVNRNLVHVFIIDHFSYLVTNHLSKTGFFIVRYLCFWLFTFSLAFLLNISVERPFLKLRDRFWPKKRIDKPR